MATEGFRITYNGKLVLTSAQFAARHGMTKETARKTLSRLGVAPIEEPLDERTKVWPAAALTAAMKKRPGKGANLRGHG